MGLLIVSIVGLWMMWVWAVGPLFDYEPPNPFRWVKEQISWIKTTQMAVAYWLADLVFCGDPFLWVLYPVKYAFWWVMTIQI